MKTLGSVHARRSPRAGRTSTRAVEELPKGEMDGIGGGEGLGSTRRTRQQGTELMTWVTRLNIDGLLVRFDVLRNRAANRGGMAVNFNGLGWIILNALGATPDHWERLLFRNEERLPEGWEMTQVFSMACFCNITMVF